MIDLTYRNLDSPIHNLGVTSKIILFGSLGTLSLIYSDLLFLASVVVTCLALIWLAKVGENVAGFLRLFLIFSAIVFCINLVANQNGENPIFRTNFRFYLWRISFQLTLESLSSALQMILRLFAMVLAFLAFTLTTKPEKILDRISRLRGFEGFGMLLALSYRFLPLLVSDGVQIRDSLSSRGIRFDDGGRLERAKSYASLGIPLIVNSLDRSLQLAEAMESRGYRGGRARSATSVEKPTRLAWQSLYYFGTGLLFLILWLILGIGRATLFFDNTYAIGALVLFVAFIAPTFFGGSKA